MFFHCFKLSLDIEIEDSDYCEDFNETEIKESYSKKEHFFSHSFFLSLRQFQ
jgi:hypothetical protein